MLHAAIDIDNAFVHACSNHFIDVAEWLHSINPNRNEYVYNEAFRSACKSCKFRGHLNPVNTAKWLLSIKPDIQVSDSDVEELLLSSLSRSDAMWVLSIIPNKTNYKLYAQIAVVMLDSSRFELAELVGLEAHRHTNINVYLDIRDELFCIACANGYLNAANWLRPIEAPDDDAFNMAYRNNRQNIMEWLCSLNPVKYKRRLMFATPVPKTALETVTANSVSDIEPCTICFETIPSTLVCLQTNCGHWMCCLCFNKVALMSHRLDCPYCRQPILHATEYMLEQVHAFVHRT